MTPATPDSLRLFIAVELPFDVRTALADVQARLKVFDTERAVRWSAPDSIHLTLKFLGETHAGQRDVITTALVKAAEGQGAFDLVTAGIGCFPTMRQPRVVWAGLEGDLSALHHLRDIVERTMAPLGFPTEARPFSPHLTLGRSRQDARRSTLTALGEQLAKLDAGRLAQWRVMHISLMRSELKPSGAVYTALAQIPLIEPSA